MVSELQLTGAAHTSVVEGVGGVKSTVKSIATSIQIASSSGLFSQTIEVRSMNSPLGSLQPVDWNQFKHYWPHMADVHFPTPVPNHRVDIIVGIDYPWLTEPLMTRRAPLSNQAMQTPIALYTRLGWTAGGPLVPPECMAIPTPTRRPSLPVNNHVASCLRDIQRDSAEPSNCHPLAKYGTTLEEMLKLLPPAPERHPGVFLNHEDRAAMVKMYEGITKLDNGHYQVPVLWLGAGRPPNNRKEAAAEWNRNLARLKDASLHCEFDKIIQHWLDSDFIEELPDKAYMDRNAFYLPYFAVLRPDKPTSPVRIVMNGKAVFGPNKVSLNDCIARGPKLLNDLVEVLMRFRQQPIGLSCDIKEMFLNVYMPPEDWDWHRFFYTRPDKQKSSIFRAKVHQFGSRGSPDATEFAMKFHALLVAATLLLASIAILDHSIVDDGLVPIKDQNTGKQTVQELIQFAAGLGMTVPQVGIE